MKLSIIVPIYNVEQWLSDTIESILAQSFRDFELILVDDGATDGSGAICDQYAVRDSRIRVIHQKNAGVSAARNAGVAAARGEHIGFVDSDDIVETDMYEIMMELAYTYSADIVQCFHDRAITLNASTRCNDVEIMDGKSFVRRLFTKKSADYTNQVSLCTKIIRRELFEGITFPVGQVYEDEQETYKICLKARKIVETPNVLYHYVRRDNSIITGVSAEKMLDKQLALLDRLNYLPEVIPDLKEKCALSFVRYSEHILCRMDGKALEKGIAVLLDTREQYHTCLNKYEKLYFPMLRLPFLRRWILRNEFAPIQNVVARLRGR